MNSEIVKSLRQQYTRLTTANSPQSQWPWLQLGWTFLSGIPEPLRRERVIVAIQAWIDDSGGVEHPRHVLAGQIAPAVMWAEFADEWAAALRATPTVHSFKMDDAVGRNNSWYRLSERERDAKLERLARIISRYGFTAIHCTTDPRVFREISAGQVRPFNDSLFFPFHLITLGCAWDLLARGQGRPFEIFFDRNRLEKRFRDFYYLVRAVAPADIAAILPVEPLFRSDNGEMALQAADMMAWFFRSTADGADPSAQQFAWLVPILGTCPVSQFSTSFVGTGWRARFDRVYPSSLMERVANAYDDLFDA